MIRLLLIASIGAVLSACASNSIQEIPVQEPIQPNAQFTPVEMARPQTASLWNQEPQSLFGNRRARNVGDILTVIVSVDEIAEMQNSLERTRTSNENFNANALFGVPEWAANTLPGGSSLTPGVDLSRSADLSGDGSVRRQERITLQLAAEVIEQRPNGHLVILGTQRIRVNHEIRDLRLHGIVRPEDITRDNTITHEKIAAADIVYTGRGQVTATTKPRWGSQLLDILVPV